MKQRYWSKLVRLLTGTLTVGALAGFGNCSPSMRQICEDRLPRLERHLEDSVAALEPWRGARGGRSPASAAREDEMSADDRATWTRWAESQLRETQGYIDASTQAGRRSDVGRQLTDIANQLVTFHGYARAGDVERMVAALSLIRRRAASAREMGCLRGQDLVN